MHCHRNGHYNIMLCNNNIKCNYFVDLWVAGNILGRLNFFCNKFYQNWVWFNKSGLVRVIPILLYIGILSHNHVS